MKLRILIFGEMPPFSIHGVSLSNKFVSEILKSKFIVDEIVERRSTVSWNVSIGKKSVNTVLDLVSILLHINNNRYHYIYTPFPTSVLGSLKISFILILKNIFSKRTKCILHVHRGDLMAFYTKNYFSKNIVRFCFNRAQRVIVLSDTLRNELRYLGFNRVVSIANTVMEDIAPLPCNKSSNDIVMIANYHVDKGFYVILDALKILKARGREWNVNFYGDGDPSDFEKYANKLGVKKYCNFSKPIFGTAKAQVIEASKILVLPSFNEGQPLVLLEAMKLSTLIIASKVGYIEETLGRDYPFVVEAGNPLMLAECIDSVMSIPNYGYYVRYLNDRFQNSFSKDVFEQNIKSLFD